MATKHLGDWVLDAVKNERLNLYTGKVITWVVNREGKQEIFFNTGCFYWDGVDPTRNVCAVPREMLLPKGGYRITKKNKWLDEAKAGIENSTLSEVQKATCLAAIDHVLNQL